MIQFKKMIQQIDTIDKVYCNMCCKEINTQNNDYIHINKVWGYCSKKDTKEHVFDLCESCYDKIIKQMKIPPDIKYNLQF